jgi:hypothetical protein
MNKGVSFINFCQLRGYSICGGRKRMWKDNVVAEGRGMVGMEEWNAMLIKYMSWKLFQ